MRISDWSSDVCSSDLTDRQRIAIGPGQLRHVLEVHAVNRGDEGRRQEGDGGDREDLDDGILLDGHHAEGCVEQEGDLLGEEAHVVVQRAGVAPQGLRSEEHTSELQSLMRISYAVFCLKKQKKIRRIQASDAVQ